jgi:Acyltransferase family
MPQMLVPSRHEARAQSVEDHFPSKVTYTHSPRVFGLDFLRALAILFVLVAHGTGLLMPFVPWWFAFFGHGGFYGVELFFVLSGFLIGTILVRSGSELGKPDHVAVFYIRRRFRTPPLFWLFLGVHTAVEQFNTMIVYFQTQPLMPCLYQSRAESTGAAANINNRTSRRKISENEIEYLRRSLFDLWPGTVDIFAAQHRRPVRRNHFAVMAFAQTSGNKLHAYFTQFFFRFFLIDTKPCDNSASRNSLIG